MDHLDNLRKSYPSLAPFFYYNYHNKSLKGFYLMTYVVLNRVKSNPKIYFKIMAFLVTI